MIDSTSNRTVTDSADTTDLDSIGLGVAGDAEDVEVDAFAAGVFEPPAKHARLEVLRVLGSRMREARDLCRLSQQDAARRLGCKASQLARIESVTDNSSVPLWLICRAAEVYEVGAGYLLGEGGADDWETGYRMTQEREVSAWLAKAWADSRVHDVKARLRLEAKIDAMRDAVVATMDAARELEAALNRFSELNPEFEEDMRGSARLSSAVESVAIAAAKAGADLRRVGLGKVASA